jgi:cellulose synthase/poly-beta-1,6-N-acetylglucosamine synthase-like glycosyltransferase
MIFQALLVAAVLLFLYPFCIYPALMLVLVRPRGRRIPPPPHNWPSVAIVICALNEQKIIREKMKNTLALHYPKEKLRIVVVSDGSTDATPSIVREFVPAGVRFIDQAMRRGKVTNLNEVITAATEDIIVSTDANVFLEPDAVQKLVATFEDSTVGAASGRIAVTGTTEMLSAPEENFFSIEWLLQDRATQIYSMPAVDGSLFAFRRELFVPCPTDTIIEDFIVAMQIVRQGKRIVFQPAAGGWETGATTTAEEFRRKVRIAAGAAQGLVRGNAWPKGAPLRFFWIYFSHKLLRWFSPLLGLLAALLAVLSWTYLFSQLVLAALVGVIAAAALRLVTRWQHPLLNAPFYFLLGQCSLALGLAKGLVGRQSVLWAKADR